MKLLKFCLLSVIAVVALLLASTAQAGTSSGWIKYPGNPVLGGKFGTCFDLSLLQEGDTYRMWFSWRPKDSIGYSESKDGVHWSDPIIVLKPAGGWEGIVNRISVIFKDGKYHMWYTGQLNINGNYQGRIGYATSPDGINWTRVQKEPVYSPQAPWEKDSVMCPSVIWEESEKIFKMWYSAGEWYEPNAIGYATSPDGVHWKCYSQDPVFAADKNIPWEHHKVAGGHVLKHKGWYYIFYAGYENDFCTHTGLARSKDGITNWERLKTNPISSPDKGAWDGLACYKPYAIYDEKADMWRFWYNARLAGLEQIGLVLHKGEDLGFPAEQADAKADEKKAEASDYSVTPVPFTNVKVNDTFWLPRLNTTRDVTIPDCFKKCEPTRIPNFARAAGLEPGPFQGISFDDSDVYKIIEGAAYALALQKNEELEKYTDSVIEKIAKAQEEDGYLYTSRTIYQKYSQYKPLYTPPGGKERWSNMDGHELYCFGHLYEAGCAYYQATGKRTLLDVAIKNADLVCQTFGVDKKQNWAPGHQEIEIGLVKLYRITGDKKYLDQAKYFLDIRGKAEGRTFPLLGIQYQDHQPVIEQKEAIGHAVRAAYMYAGMADVAAMTGDPSYVKAIDTIWDNVVGSKLYITGGIGALAQREAFDKSFVLPNDTAYCETCANIANVYWNHRMFLSTGDSKFIDVMERSLYNSVISGISLSGDHYFYPNVLDAPEGRERSEWFACSCCPSNLCRFLASMPGYMYAVRGNDVYINLYAQSEATLPGVTVDGKATDVKVKVETNYPWDGTVKVTVLTDGQYTVKARIPGWARGEAVPEVYGVHLHWFLNFDESQKATCNANGKDVQTDGGYFVLKSNWKAGDTFTLNFPMQTLQVVTEGRVQADVGRSCLQRGPLVYCLEAQDGIVKQTGKQLSSIRAVVLPDNTKLGTAFRSDLLGGVMTITGVAKEMVRNMNGTVSENDVEFSAIPYYAWANRGKYPMSVYLARTPNVAQPAMAQTIATMAKVKASYVSPKYPGPVESVNNLTVPKNKSEWLCPHWHWWSKDDNTLGQPQWIEYEFAKPETVHQVGLFWFDDVETGGCHVPKSWKLLYKTESGEWKEVSNPSEYGIKKYAFNTTTFDPVKTTGLRIEIESEPNYAGGIYEWTVE